MLPLIKKSLAERSDEQDDETCGDYSPFKYNHHEASYPEVNESKNKNFLAKPTDKLKIHIMSKEKVKEVEKDKTFCGGNSTLYFRQT